MKVRLETSGKIALIAVLGVATYFGISHFRNKSGNTPVSDSSMVVKDSGSSFQVDTLKSNTTIYVETDPSVDTPKHVAPATKHKTVAPKHVSKPDVKIEPKKKTEGRSSLDIEY
jgi:hypothetical protein